MNRLYRIVVVAIVAFLTACGSQVQHLDDESKAYSVVATVGMIGDVVRSVAGDRASVDTVIGEGVDPHLYKPTRGDVIRLNQADVIFYNGLLLEGKMTDILKKMQSENRPVVAVAEAIDKDSVTLLSKEQGVDESDPHLWMDVEAWKAVTSVIKNVLVSYDPSYEESYAANADSYIQRLDLLDEYAKAALSSIPENQRTLITAHDAFQYLGQAYGIKVRGIQGLSTESEAGIKDLENLVDLIVEKKIPAIFVESSVADKNVKAIVEGAKARGHNVKIGGTLYSDAMGPAGSYEGTYIGMIDHNVTTIANALGGSAVGFEAFTK